MLLTKSLKITLNRGNVPYFKKFDKFKKYKIGDEIDADIKYIPKTSKYTIEVQCDICGKTRKILYSTYWESTKKETEIYCCRGKCANIKRENTNMELYGIKNCFQDVEKVKAGMMKNHGVEHNMQLEKCLNDRKQTYLKNWGVDNPSKNIAIQIKKENTCLKNHGVKSPYQNRNIFIKSMTNGKALKKYKDTELNYQGSYEKDFLDKYYNLISIKNGLEIPYNFKNKSKKYYSDFYIQEYDLIIEIKSTYWYFKYEDQNITKASYSKKDHNYIIILDKNYEELDNLLNIR